MIPPKIYLSLMLTLLFQLEAEAIQREKPTLPTENSITTNTNNNRTDKVATGTDQTKLSDISQSKQEDKYKNEGKYFAYP